MASTNSLERVDKETKRTTDVVASSPTGHPDSGSPAVCSSSSTTSGPWAGATSAWNGQKRQSGQRDRGGAAGVARTGEVDFRTGQARGSHTTLRDVTPLLLLLALAASTSSERCLNGLRQHVQFVRRAVVLVDALDSDIRDHCHQSSLGERLLESFAGELSVARGTDVLDFYYARGPDEDTAECNVRDKALAQAGANAAPCLSSSWKVKQQERFCTCRDFAEAPPRFRGRR